MLKTREKGLREYPPPKALHPLYFPHTLAAKATSFQKNKTYFRRLTDPK